MPASTLKTLTFLLLLSSCGTGIAADPEKSPLQGVRRVVFLGDSITYAGQYIDFVEAYLRIKQPQLRCEFLNLGLPSETVSGLSEPGHAGGQFPRPDLHERLDRVLEQTRPGLVVACYGMNDGIYYPFSEERFAKFQEGMRDCAEPARSLVCAGAASHAAGLRSGADQGPTLPAGLAEYRQPYEGYDEVLDRYSEWLLAQRASGWDVVDVHGPMKRYLAATRSATRPSALPMTASTRARPATGSWLAKSCCTGGYQPASLKGRRRRLSRRHSSPWPGNPQSCPEAPERSQRRLAHSHRSPPSGQARASSCPTRSDKPARSRHDSPGSSRPLHEFSKPGVPQTAALAFFLAGF